MDSQYIGTVIISIFLVILIYSIIIIDNDDKKFGHSHEDFLIYNNIKNKYCNECANLSYIGCSKCNNCGICYTPDGYSECVSGDELGPYFRQDCVNYEYNSLSKIGLDLGYDRSWYYPDRYHSRHSIYTNRKHHRNSNDRSARDSNNRVARDSNNRPTHSSISRTKKH